MVGFLRTMGVLLITAGLLLFFFLAFARAYDYEQAAKARPKVGKALYCSPARCRYL